MRFVGETRRDATRDAGTAARFTVQRRSRLGFGSRRTAGDRAHCTLHAMRHGGKTDGISPAGSESERIAGGDETRRDCEYHLSRSDGSRTGHGSRRIASPASVVGDRWTRELWSLTVDGQAAGDGPGAHGRGLGKDSRLKRECIHASGRDVRCEEASDGAFEIAEKIEEKRRKRRRQRNGGGDRREGAREDGQRRNVWDRRDDREGGKVNVWRKGRGERRDERDETRTAGKGRERDGRERQARECK
ncbi:hypothetical protein FKP32DRAFT_15718 [Trametes sanguinea]|nr:hypothetical protein FKP32DRAFT_15718 [Trametes sanguinea]